MTEIETKLRELIAKICNNPSELQGSERKRLLNRLLITVHKLPKLLKSSHIYYLEALDKTFEWLCRSICKFEPSLDDSLPYEEELTRWINVYLYYRIIDLYKKKPEPINLISLDQPMKSPDNDSLKTLLDVLLSKTSSGIPTLASEIPTLYGLEEYIERLQKEKNKKTFLEFEIYVEKDLERRLRNCHPREYPDCNCQILCQRILLQNPPEKMSVLSRELGIKYQTLVAHWNRSCKPLLQEILLELGYCSS